MHRIILSILFLGVSLSVTYSQKQFWGTASQGGLYGNGFIFKTDSIGDNLEIVHHFQSAVDGENISALLYASNNKLYGLAADGGVNTTGPLGGGTFFEYDLSTDQFKVLQHFGPGNTALPNVVLPLGDGKPGLIEVSPGILYGLMNQGNYVFSYNIATNTFSQPFVIPTYQGGASNSTLQNKLVQVFYKASDGYLYATTQTNSSCPIGNPNMGSIIRVNPTNNTLTIRYKSSCLVDAGYIYSGDLVEANGKFYSTTYYGGTNNKGVIYEYTPSTNIYVKKYDFAGSAYSYEPSSLVMGKNGKLYGTAHGGGIPETYLPAGGGVLYEFDPATNIFTKKYDFVLGVSWLGDVGSFPGGLVNSTNGKLYGATQFGVFEYNITTNELRMAGRFWYPGFAPSLKQICRKPAYQFQAVSSHSICEGSAFSVDLASTNTTSAVWKHNNVIDPSRTTPLLNFTSFSEQDAGTWICTLTNECGSTTAQTITLTLNEPDQPAITASGPVTFCDGENVTLSAPNGYNSYTWSNGANTQAIVVSESGEYTVSVNNGCESPLSEITTVTVHDLPAAPTAIEVPSLNTLKAIGTSTIYEWSLNDVVLNEQTKEIIAAESGVYKVRSISAEGCRSDDFASLSFTITGTETSAENTIILYPNPAKGMVYIQVNNSLLGQALVSLFNTTGGVVFSQSITFTEKTNVLHLENLPAGIYTMMIRKGEKVVLKKVAIK
ncbi:MAG TPA: choice-of-anchor tandem repeat GloVer-containing protein [Ohtaekwangia sp.]|uniref:T9SS type A sorting domain-containing protein n=1 Tax=Ohtaekwangia sp. TaxID=2066019 RepID=UPI002F92EA8A